MKQPRKKYGPIDFKTGVCWIKNYYSTQTCHKCGAALAYGDRVLFSPKLRRAACEPCGEDVQTELIKSRLERERENAPATKAEREAYERSRPRANPNVISLQAL